MAHQLTIQRLERDKDNGYYIAEIVFNGSVGRFEISGEYTIRLLPPLKDFHLYDPTTFEPPRRWDFQLRIRGLDMCSRAMQKDVDRAIRAHELNWKNRYFKNKR